jgi:hypothetical protein
VIPNGSGELLRAAAFYTPKNPFRNSPALESFSDRDLQLPNGRMAACERRRSAGVDLNADRRRERARNLRRRFRGIPQ